MKILIGCEESQTVCKAFRAKGHEAYSNDIIDCSGGHPEWHLKMDVFEAIELMGWDMIIIHPPCTALAVSGNGTYGSGKQKHSERILAVKWTQHLWDFSVSKCSKVAMENPVGVLNRMGDFPKPQYIQPWMFGNKEVKKTGIWISGLPPLTPADIVGPPPTDKEERKSWEKIWRMPPGEDRARLRSKTYQGISEAIADRWA